MSIKWFYSTKRSFQYSSLAITDSQLSVTYWNDTQCSELIHSFSWCILPCANHNSLILAYVVSQVLIPCTAKWEANNPEFQCGKQANWLLVHFNYLLFICLFVCLFVGWLVGWLVGLYTVRRKMLKEQAFSAVFLQWLVALSVWDCLWTGNRPWVGWLNNHVAWADTLTIHHLSLWLNHIPLHCHLLYNCEC